MPLVRVTHICRMRCLEWFQACSKETMRSNVLHAQLCGLQRLVLAVACPNALHSFLVIFDEAMIAFVSMCAHACVLPGDTPFSQLALARIPIDYPIVGYITARYGHNYELRASWHPAACAPTQLLPLHLLPLHLPSARHVYGGMLVYMYIGYMPPYVAHCI
jgi:hypothetical protein